MFMFKPALMLKNNILKRRNIIQETKSLLPLSITACVLVSVFPTRRGVYCCFRRPTLMP